MKQSQAPKGIIEEVTLTWSHGKSGSLIEDESCSRGDSTHIVGLTSDIFYFSLGIRSKISILVAVKDNRELFVYELSLHIFSL